MKSFFLNKMGRQYFWRLFFVIFLANPVFAFPDYFADLKRVEDKINRYKSINAKNDHKNNRYEEAYAHFERATLTHSLADYQSLEKALDLCDQSETRVKILRAYYFSKVHRNKKALELIQDLRVFKQQQEALDLLKKSLQSQLGLRSETKKSLSTWQDLADEALRMSHVGQAKDALDLYEKAEKKLHQLSEFNPRHLAWLKVQKAELYFEYEKPALARKELEEANTAYKNYWLVEASLAEAYFLLGMKDESIKLWHKLLENFHQAEHIFEMAKDLFAPKEIEALVKKGQLYYERYLSIYPEALYRHYQDFLLFQPAKLEQALKFAEKDYGLRPTSEALMRLGQIELKLGKCAQARSRLVGIDSSKDYLTVELAEFRQEFGRKCSDKIQAQKGDADRTKLLKEF